MRHPGDSMPIDDHDERSIRCKRLGHGVTFRYCRLQEGHTVCPHILDCWWEKFDVRGFLEEHLPEEDVAKLLNREPKPKILSLIELIEQAKRRRKGSPDG